MRRVRRSPDDVLAELPDDVRTDLKRMDELISEALPGRSHTAREGVFRGGSDTPTGSGKVRTGLASISFRRPDDLDVDAFSELVRRASEPCPPSPG